MSMDMTGDPGQIISNFVKDIGTSSFLPAFLPWQQTRGITFGEIKNY
jgi:hypothetical protein